MSNKVKLLNEQKQFNYKTATLPEMQQENQRRHALLMQQGLMIPNLEYQYMVALLETLLGDNLENGRKRYESSVAALLDLAEKEAIRAKLLQGVNLSAQPTG